MRFGLIKKEKQRRTYHFLNLLSLNNSPTQQKKTPQNFHPYIVPVNKKH